MKTLVTAKHAAGPAANGYDGCYARVGCAGRCPGLEVAAWLNSLGDDDAPYRSWMQLTNGEVRDNYIRWHQHVVAVEPERARLIEARRRTERSLQTICQQLEQLDAQVTR